MKFKNVHPALWLLLAIGCLIRFANIGYRSLWADEAWVATLATGPFDKILIGSRGELGHPLPPGFAFFIWLWAHITNASSEAMFRLWPAAFSIGVIIVAYVLTNRLWNKHAAVFAAAAATGWEILIGFAHELKQYSGAVFFVFLMIILGERFKERPTIRRGLTLALVGFVGISYSFQVTTAVFAVYLILGLSLLFSSDFRTKGLRPFFVSVLALEICAVAIWLVALRFQWVEGWDRAGWGWAPCLIAFSGTGALVELFKSAAGFLSRPYGVIQLSVSVVGLLLWPKVARKRVLIYLAAILSIALSSSAIGFQPLCHRQVLFLLPFLILGVAGVLGFISEKLDLAVTGPLAVVVALLLAAPNIEKFVFAPHKLKAEESRSVARKLVETCSKDDVLYVYYGGLYAFSYYGRGAKCRVYKGTRNREDLDRYLEEIWPLIFEGERLFIFFSHAIPKEMNYITSYLRKFGELKLIASDVGAAAYVLVPDYSLKLEQPP